MRIFLLIPIYTFFVVIGSDVTLSHAKNPDDLIVIAQAIFTDNKDEKNTENEVERIQKNLAKLVQDLSKAIAEGNKKASESINAAIEETKKKLKKAMESEQKDQTKNK